MSRQREWQKRRNAEGKCSRCAMPLEPGRTSRCDACVAKERAAYKKKTDARRAAGVCVECGAGPIAKRSRCAAHVATLRKAERLRYRRLPRTTRVDGMNACGLCGGRGHNRATCDRALDLDAAPTPERKAS